MIQVWVNYPNGCGYYFEGQSELSIRETVKFTVKNTGSSDPTQKNSFSEIRDQIPMIKIKGMESNDRINFSIELQDLLKVA